jgi:energy-converting hydrogenase Eha subunit C
VGVRVTIMMEMLDRVWAVMEDKGSQFDVEIEWNSLLEHMGYSLLALHVMWYFEDRTNPKKASNLFTLSTAVVCGAFSTAFVLTSNPLYTTVAHAWFASGMIMDMAYGYIYYPDYMYFATTTVHHIAYLIMEYYLMKVYLPKSINIKRPQTSLSLSLTLSPCIPSRHTTS